MWFLFIFMLHNLKETILKLERSLLRINVLSTIYFYFSQISPFLDLKKISPLLKNSQTFEFLDKN